MNWPDANGISAVRFAQLLRHVELDALKTRFGLSNDQLQHWRQHGVPTGPHAALFRYFARDNGIHFDAAPTGLACILCGAPGDLDYGGHPVCNYCYDEPEQAGQQLGYHFNQGGDYRFSQRGSGITAWIGVKAPTSFELPVAATMRRQRGMWFAKPDPEIGHPEFDDAVHITTDDYEALFDLFQHPRRRQLAQALAQDLELQIDVDSVYALFPGDTVFYLNRLKLNLLLLAWSLVNDRSPHLVDQ